jgi:hypothetical protein
VEGRQKVAKRVGRWMGGKLTGGKVEWVGFGWSDGWNGWKGEGLAVIQNLP